MNYLTETDLFPRRYWTAEIWPHSKPTVWEIDAAAIELVRNPKTGIDDQKLVLRLVGSAPGFIVNKTNFGALKAGYGADYRTWVRKNVRVTKQRSPFGNAFTLVVDLPDEVEVEESV